MKKLTKVFAVLSIYFFLLIIDGCVNCNCPDVTLKYFDFRKVETIVEDQEIDSNDVLNFQFAVDSIYYLANLGKQPCWSLGLINTATACSCNEPGDSGWKFPISQIDITSNKDFNSSLPANSSLNSIMTVNAQSILTPLIDATENSFSQLQYSEGGNQSFTQFSIYTEERPDDINESYIFTIKITKSNGEEIITESPPITWN